MKRLLIISAIFAVAATAPSKGGYTVEEMKTKTREYHEECQKDPETHVDENTIPSHEDDPDKYSPEVGRHFICVLHKFGYVDKNGDIDVATLKSIAKRQGKRAKEMERIVDECAKNKETKEKTIMHFMHCMFENGPQKTHFNYFTFFNN